MIIRLNGQWLQFNNRKSPTHLTTCSLKAKLFPAQAHMHTHTYTRTHTHTHTRSQVSCKDTGTQSRSDHSCLDKRVKVKVAQSCLTLCDPVDYTVHGILQVRILWWAAFPFSRGSSQPRDRTHVSLTAGRLQEPLWKSQPNCPAPPSGYTEKYKSAGAKTTVTAIACLLLPRHPLGSLSPAFGAVTGWACLAPRHRWSGVLGRRLRPLLPSQPPHGSQQFEAKDPVSSSFVLPASTLSSREEISKHLVKKKGKKTGTERRKEGC